MSKGMDTYDYLADFFGARQYENYKFQMREIEKLKRKKKELEQKVNRESDPDKAEDLKKQLAQVERELSQKDNDSYRRRHTVFH